MRKLYDIFKVSKIQKIIVSAETIRGNMVVNSKITSSSKDQRGELKII